ncbi:hypothetical protein Rvan_1920 [Rhodomicrobium vannielii ATCC 17100]|uniref:DUF2157 domain-containing protein n=1 Tax=Rhodomicrobium vannielii (strain ATCC 17100 / DSM 162 / LMG 4299 / NCIMB 10020 / ATH 3.1.1) TaxID=648757 RepID=E3I0R6_RHOVT|nr:hypothetical protein [Rhodomicrobium vannielii]ADP71156.1 hypothetical protein Rvan_1920 [Rhodomicrobium vannielii ATCC 17100]
MRVVVGRNQAKAILSAVVAWKQDGALDPAVAERLAATIVVRGFDWKALAKYCFWVALACVVIAIGAVLADEQLLALLRRIFSAPYQVKSAALGVLAGAFYWLGARRREVSPHKVFSNEAIMALGGVATVGAVGQLSYAFDAEKGHLSLLLLLASLIYAAVALWSRSNLIWIFALLSLCSWMGAESGYVSGFGMYYLGMDYPIRFVAFGAFLAVAGVLVERSERFPDFARSTLVVGLLYFFIALWILSIFGYQVDFTHFHRSGDLELALWSIAFGLAALVAIGYGLRCEHGTIKGFGLTFLGIALYTKFFEHFWDGTHKAIFFAILAVSFWLLGSRAEKIWHIGERKTSSPTTESADQNA